MGFHSLTASRKPVTSKMDNKRCGRGCGPVKPPSLLLAEWEMVKVVSESPWEYINILNTELQEDPAIP